MNSRIGYFFMKLFTRHRSDPITDALNGSLPADPSVVAFIEQLRAAAGAEELVLVSPPMDTITDVVVSGPDPIGDDLQPVGRRGLGPRLARWATTAGVATKVLFGAAALAAVTTTAAVTGSLPAPVQDFVADSVDRVGIEIPHSDTTSAPPESTPPSTAVGTPEERDAYREAVQEHNDCVLTARKAYIEANGNASGFDAAAACGDRPDPDDYKGNRSGSENPGRSAEQQEKQAEKNAEKDKDGSPADTRPGRNEGTGGNRP